MDQNFFIVSFTVPCGAADNQCLAEHPRRAVALQEQPRDGPHRRVDGDLGTLADEPPFPWLEHVEGGLKTRDYCHCRCRSEEAHRCGEQQEGSRHHFRFVGLRRPTLEGDYFNIVLELISRDFSHFNIENRIQKLTFARIGSKHGVGMVLHKDRSLTQAEAFQFSKAAG